MSRTIVALVVIALLQTSILVGIGEAGTDGPSQLASTEAADRTGPRVFNATEYMGYTATAPTVDGVINAAEYTDAAVYTIGRTGKTVILYLMYDSQKIYTAIDAVDDVTNDPEGPEGTGSVATTQSDYMLLSFDGDNDGLITYQDVPAPPPQNEQPSQQPLTRGGLCVDRGTSTAGSKFVIAGWWAKNLAGTGNVLWNVQTGVNQGTDEPYDYINTTFTNGHRMYEHSIPYSGAGDELGLSSGDTFGYTLFVNDKGNGMIGAFPVGAGGVTAPYQHISLLGKPKSLPKITSTPLVAGPPKAFGTGMTIEFDGADSKDDTTISTYTWNFGDGSTTQTGTKVTHAFTTPGLYFPSLTVKDADNIQDVASIPVQIVVAPVLSNISNPTPTPGPLTVPEGSYVDLTISYDDANLLAGVGEELNITWTQDGEVIKTEKRKSEADTSTFRFEAAYDGANSQRAGPYIINVTVDDVYDYGNFQGEANVSVDWSITVTETNRRPVVTRVSPETEAAAINEGQQQAFGILKSDPDKNTMTVGWFVNGVEIPTAKNKDSFAFPVVPGFNTSGNYLISVKVTDNGVPPLYSEMFWNLSINNINQAPTIKGHTPTVATPSVKEGTSLLLSVVVDDPDKDKLFFTWYVDGVSVTGADGLSYNYTPGFKDSRHSPIDIMVEVTDGDATLPPASFEWTVTITDVDRPTNVVVDDPEEYVFPLSEDILFDASSTTDPDEDPSDALADTIEFTWSFGDGVNKTGDSVKHTYKAPGQYTAQLTVVTMHEGKEVETVGWTQEITIQAAELNVVSISTDTASATEEDMVAINVTIENKGALDAKLLKVTLIMDSSATSQFKTVDIKAGEIAVVNFEWKARVGTHTFKVDLAGDKDMVVLDKTAQSGAVVVSEKKAPPPGGAASTMTGGGNTLWILLIIILVVVVVLGAAVYSSNKKKKQRELEEKLRHEEEARIRAEQDRQRAEEEARRRAAEAAAAAAAAAAAQAAAQRQAMIARQQQQAAAAPQRPPAFKVAVAPPPPPTPKPRPASFSTPEPTPEPKAQAPAEPKPAQRPATFNIPKTGPEKIGGAPDIKKCPHCGEEVEPDWATCPACAKPLKAGMAAIPPKPSAKPQPTAQGPSKKCPGCGEEVEADWRKCPECGKDIK